MQRYDRVGNWKRRGKEPGFVSRTRGSDLIKVGRGIGLISHTELQTYCIYVSTREKRERFVFRRQYDLQGRLHSIKETKGTRIK